MFSLIFLMPSVIENIVNVGCYMLNTHNELV